MRTLIDEILEFESPTAPPAKRTVAQERKMVNDQLMRGNYDENSLTDLVFHARYPGRRGRRLSKSEPNFHKLAREWRNIREKIVWAEMCAVSECIFIEGKAP